MEKIQKVIRKLPQPLRNKYIILFVIFILWIVFLDDYNLIKQNRIKIKVNELKNQKEFYIDTIEKDSTELSNLKNNPKIQEKFAREKFLMKRDNEDVFIIRKKEDE